MAREPEFIAQQRRALGGQLRAFRNAAGMFQSQLAEATHSDRSTVAHIEGGRSRAEEHFWKACDEKLGANGDLLALYRDLLAAKHDHEHQQRQATISRARTRLDQLTNGTRPAASPSVDGDGAWGEASAMSLRLDGDYVETVYNRIRELVALDGQFGGDQSCGVALRLFRSIHRKLGSNRCAPAVENDLYAAAGELGEVAGWLLYDAGKHDLVRSVNHEALHLSRLAGDQSMELLIQQNMSMHAGHLGRSSEALRIARMVLETTPLSPRLEALFRTREARALAQGGDETAADRTFRQAQSLYSDGVRDDDPAWAWWITDTELAWHHAMIHADSGNFAAAIDSFHTSVEELPRNVMRGRYCHLAFLLDAQIRAAAWTDAGQTIEQVLPFVDEVGSTRTATTLHHALDNLDKRTQATSTARDGAAQLRGVLVDAGYPRP